MADFGLGSNATGHLNATQVWNSSTQVRYRLTLSVTVTGNAFHYGPGPTWSSNMGGHSQSGSWTYPGSGTRHYTLANYEVTFNKDANGYITVGFSGHINGDNSPYVTSNGTSFNMSPARIGIAPGIAGINATNIKTTSARLGAELTDVGLGTSAALRMYYRKGTSGSWISLGDQGDVPGWNYWNVNGLVPGTTYQYFVRVWNNNGDTRDSGVQSFKTKPAGAFFARGFGL